MKTYYTLLILLIPFVGMTQDCFYCEDFENVTAPALPLDVSTSSIEENYYIPVDGNNVQVQGFFTGTIADAGSGGYWTYLEEHTTFAMTSDDACLPVGATPGANNNCDLIFEVLELPSLNFAEGDSGMWLQFEFYHDKNWGGGDAYVEISTDGGDNFSDLSGPLPEIQAWQSAAYNLSDYYADTNVVIRFIWSDNGSWASGFAIDDIIVNPLPEYAMKLNEYLQLFPSAYFGGTTYQTVPLSQASSSGYNFAGYVKNMGLNTLDSARLYASISSEGFTSQSFANNTTSLSTDSFYCNDVFIPTNTGFYEAEIYAADENGTQTEIKTVEFNVSDNEYARDDADFTGGYSGGSYVNNDGTEQRGNIFDIYADALLYAIKVRIHPATSPGCMAKGVLNMVDIETGDVSYLTETAEMNVGSMTDDWMNFVFDVPVQLMAGDVVLPTIYANYDAVDTLVIAQSGNSQPGETLLQDIDGVSGDPGEWYFTSSTPMVRLNFDPSLVVEGCIDEIACNFNENANTDDGSCLYPVNFEETNSACNEFNWNGELYTQSGEYTYVTSGSNGCDSITTLNLTIINSININLDITSCDEYSWQGEVYTESGTYTYETVNENGCDSIVNLNLSIVGGLESQTIIGQDEVEPFSSHIYALTLNENIYGWSVTNGNVLSDNGNNIEVLWGEAGIGLIEVVETDANGCTITHSLQVNLGNNVENSWNCVNEACVDPMDGTGVYDDINECEAVCDVVIAESWNCVNEACVDPMDGTGVYDDINECEAVCDVVIAESWNCVNNACVDPMDGTGVYDDINECEAVCDVVIAESWNCVNNACVDPMDGTGVYDDINECEAVCDVVIAESWNCVNNACVDPMDGTGVYDDINECEAVCDVVIAESWNCVNNACVDPMDGTGVYDDINECEAVCDVVIAESWNCVNNACVDPMDGSGVYDDINECEAVCDVTSINENDNEVNIYPNPSSNIFNLEFNLDSEAEITVTNVLGEQVYFESNQSIGEYNTQIDLSSYSKGIYNLTIKTSDGISNHKLILQ